MNDKSVSFAILTYNQERLIIEALESTRYQVETYKRTSGYKYYLVLIDDCSSDGTMEIVRQWIQQYRELYDGVKILFHERNMGTVASYTELMKLLETQFFIEMAGDDVLASVDITKYRNNYNTISVFPAVYLRGRSVCLRNYIYNTSFYYYLTHKKNTKGLLRIFMMGFMPYQAINGTRDKSIFFDAECDRFNSKFKLVEDAPTIYKILRDVRGIDIGFKLDSPFYLYRLNEDSVTHSNITNQVCIGDMVKLLHIYKEKSGGLMRFYYDNKIKRLQGKKTVPICSIVDRVYYFVYYVCSNIIHHKGYKRYIQFMKKRSLIETTYYNTIHNQAKDFYREYF